MTQLLTCRSLRFVGSTGKFGLARTASLLFAFCIAAVIASPAQTFTTLASFDGTNGASSYAGLVQGTNGNFYGTTLGGGTNGEGTVFDITPAGKLTTLYNFCSQPNCSDGAGPRGLILAANGNLYGITSYQEAGNLGTIFEITPAGKLTTIYRFCSQPECDDGILPSSLLQASNENFYGTTSNGGTNGTGTVFELTPKGKLTTLHTFSYEGSDTDGNYPLGLVQATDGNLYGTTFEGGPSPDCTTLSGCGTVFEMTPTGNLTTIYSFCSKANCSDGALPTGGFIQASNKNFYGTTGDGGANGCPTYAGGCGTIFQITPAGKLTTIYSFCSQTKCTDGENPSGLMQGTNGNFYGVAAGGTNNGGTVFELTTKGELTTLYNFCSQTGCTDGAAPIAGVLQGTDGILYGTTAGGGTDNDGVVFSLSVGLGPFVKTNPTAGKVGAKVIILGNDLKGATGVTFNGVDATITGDSNTAITTTVPTGATTGAVEVTTASGKKLVSNLAFQVIP
jgi:uncharacterized repeat protein (TIGR03803 family)